MRYKLLGRSGLRVSELALGAMTFGETWGWGASKDESRRIFDAFVAAGGNFIDTANNYTDGTSETYVGEFIHDARESYVVATKYTLTERRDDPNAGGNHRKNLVQTLHRSLKRLNTEYVDLLWLHMWDFMTPVEEVLRALDDLVRAGKVLYIGLSDSPAWVAAQANTIAELRGWSRFVALQLPYSLADRAPERELLPMARAFDMTVTPWGLLKGGELTGKYNSDSDTSPKRYKNADARNKRLAEQVMAIAQEIDRTPSQVAINWVRQQQARANIVPILGARSARQMLDNLGCLEFTLTPEQLQRLTDVGEFQVGFPMSFLTSSHVRSLIFGETFDMIDNHRGNPN